MSHSKLFNDESTLDRYSIETSWKFIIVWVKEIIKVKAMLSLVPFIREVDLRWAIWFHLQYKIQMCTGLMTRAWSKFLNFWKIDSQGCRLIQEIRLDNHWNSLNSGQFALESHNIDLCRKTANQVEELTTKWLRQQSFRFQWVIILSGLELSKLCGIDW